PGPADPPAPGAAASVGEEAMNTPPRQPNVLNDAAVRNYTLICVVALLVMVLELLQLHPLLDILPGLVGALGLVLRSALASLMLGLALGGRFFLYHYWGWGEFLWGKNVSFRPSDLILCGAVLAYMMGHYRLLGLVSNVFPVDPRRRDVRPPAGQPAAPV